MPVSLHRPSSACEADAPGAFVCPAPRTPFSGGRRRAAHADLVRLPEGHKRTDAPLDGGILGPVPSSTSRRVNRSMESSRGVVLAAVPAGSLRAAHGDQVTTHLRNLLSRRRMRADGLRNRLRAMAY